MSAPQGRRGLGANRLLALLAPAPRERLLAVARRVPLEFGQLLVHEGDRIEHVYFPSSGVISLIVRMQDGRGVDAAMIGFEGMVGAPVLLGEERSPNEVRVQVRGEALQIPVDALQHVMSEDEMLRDVLLRYVGVLLTQTSRSAACNRLHLVEERLAGWLLHTHDWVREDRFQLTQDILATMLGVRRATVTITLGTAQRAGLLTHRRGEITIVDRQGLEDSACEDYMAIRDAFERLLPLPTRAY